MKKWRPPNRSNLFGVAAAMSPIAKDDVFEAKIVLAGATASYNEFIICFHEFINYESTIFKCDELASRTSKNLNSLCIKTRNQFLP